MNQQTKINQINEIHTNNASEFGRQYTSNLIKLFRNA